MNIKNIVFNFNSMSHFLMAFTTLSVYKFSSRVKNIYIFGHTLISLAQYYIKYDIDKYKYLSSGLGMVGHSFLALFMYCVLKTNLNFMNIGFLISQGFMILFYINNSISDINIIKKIIFNIVLSFLSLFYVISTFTINNVSKYAYILVAIVYLNLVLYMDLIGQA